MGCKSSKERNEDDEFIIRGIGHTTRLPRPINSIPSINDEGKKKFGNDSSNPDLKKWERRSFVDPEEEKRKSFNNMDSSQLPKLNAAGQLLEEEVQKRISGSNSTTTISINGRNVHYAALTQQGFYPDNMLKPNQDAYVIKHKLGEEEVSFFGVFDGHGNEGHHCATYAKKKLPKLFDVRSRQERLKAAKAECAANDTKFVWNPKIFPALTNEQCEIICKKAHLETDKLMHADDNVSNKLSGTTAVSAILYGKYLTVSCVGDSRAVIGALGKGNPQGCTAVATSLTDDHTPYRRDELERVRKAGARVLTIDQLNNNLPAPDHWEVQEVNYEGDIPRLWLQTQKHPGTAFTRSLGDSVAQNIGVIATPEIFTKELTADDRYLVIASDGIFEFLKNQDIINTCAKHNDPYDACKAILAQSYEEWLKYEARVDDMTLIVLYFD